MNDTKIGILSLIMALIFFLCWISSCTNKQLSEKILNEQGYTKIKMKGYSLFSCSRDDWSHTKFEAIANNHKVNGVVCCDVMKNCTIRFK